MTWDYYTRQGLDLASTATSFGFTAAKTGTRLGVRISIRIACQKSDHPILVFCSQGIAHTAFAVTGAVVEHTLFQGSSIASPVLGGAVTTVISLAEQITLAPLHLGEYITTTSLLAAHGSINSEASFSLASFISLVKREWNSPTNSAYLPTTQFGIIQVAKAIVGWVALQGVTQEWQEKRWFKSLREINVNDNRRSMSTIRQRRGQIIAADIGDMPARAFNASSRWKPSGRIPNEHLKTSLRRLSKLVLAGYGGASLLFFGVSPHADATELPARPENQAGKDSEQHQLARAINASEAEAAGEPSEVDDASESVGGSKYSWWDVLLGKHDQKYSNGRERNGRRGQSQSADAHVCRHRPGNLMPRFWVLTDHGRSQIVLVLRGVCFRVKP
ncbi:lipase class [Salix suchowensis]|nr:lipase class [Salix suchowensis]